MRNNDIKKILVIGSGPIIIGQAAEFDYAGCQACKALKDEGIEVVLVNSNPATLMTSPAMASHIYIEPLNERVIERIIEKERPDSLLSTLGGQTALTLSMKLAKSGFLESHGVKLLGARVDTIDKAEDREMFKETMLSINEPVIPSLVVTDLQAARDFVHNNIGFPAIIRPAFTLGGTGGGIVNNDAELDEIASNGLHRSPIHQILVEKCISGWKEIEFEVMRDKLGNAITVCSMENLDPVGIHTGDSIVAAPCLTLSDKEYQMLRSAALNIINALGIEGGCNCQFALNPNSFEYAVIEVNPRVSRSSALASKATGYPIAKVATLIAIGYTLNEIENAVTKKTKACFEPTLDYVVVKFPKFPFDKFVYARRTLGTQMKATGEVMAIGNNFPMALMKAVRGAELGVSSLNMKSITAESDDDIKNGVAAQTDQRIFFIFVALKRNILSIDEIHNITMIDKWFLYEIQKLVDIECELATTPLTQELYKKAKNYGYTDKLIKEISKCNNITNNITNNKNDNECTQEALTARPSCDLPFLYPSYKMVDTCAGEFDAMTPYFYATYDEENEAKEFLESLHNHNSTTKKGTIIVLGSGPIRIGQGIEFDYACVECVWALKAQGYEVAIINNNPETVSTDFDTADRLYFEPLTTEDVMGVINTEGLKNIIGVVVAFGGQTAIKLTKDLDNLGIKILGTSAKGIDTAEDREKFEELCENLSIKRPKGLTVFTLEEALNSANKLGYPVLLRPSYVLGGQNMIVAFNDEDVSEYMKIILSHGIENPVLIDQYMMGIELEVDCICDGEDVLIPGIMEHIERTGIHSGDSIAVYPSWNLNDVLREKIIKQSRDLSLALGTRGLVNIQYLIYNNDLYIIEVNPRSSRTVPYISKVSGVPMVDLASRVMLGAKLSELGYGVGLYKIPPYFAVKVPVFSFEKLMDVDTHLGPEMKSTGEVLGIASTMAEALFKGLIAAGYNMKKVGGVLFSVRKTDRYELVDLARKYYTLGFTLYATEGNQQTLADFGIDAIKVNKIHENPNDNLLTLLDSGKIDYVISTSAKGRNPRADSVKMRRHAVERDIPCLTAIDTADALANCLASFYSSDNIELVDIKSLRKTHEVIHFTKMQSTGNDFIILDARKEIINNPAALAVRLCNRRSGIGADSLVLVGVAAIGSGATASMQFFNKDGSVGPMAGNAIRAVAKYIYDRSTKTNTTTDTLSIETASGTKCMTVYKLNGKVSSVTVDMGSPIFDPKSIPTKLPESAVAVDGLPKTAIINAPLEIAGDTYQVTCVSMGNPHCVVFCGFVDKVPLAKIGPLFENNENFSKKTNTEFVRVVGPNELKVRFWERGNGETPSSGTGACAAVVAAVLNGYCAQNEDITVNTPGGKMIVKYTGETVFLSGNTQELFSGEVTI